MNTYILQIPCYRKHLFVLHPPPLLAISLLSYLRVIRKYNPPLS